MKFLFNHADQSLTVEGKRYPAKELLKELNMAYIRMQNYEETKVVTTAPIEE